MKKAKQNCLTFYVRLLTITKLCRNFHGKLVTLFCHLLHQIITDSCRRAGDVKCCYTMSERIENWSGNRYDTFLALALAYGIAEFADFF